MYSYYSNSTKKAENLPLISGKGLESFFKGVSPSGAAYTGLGTGVLGALLGAGAGGVLSEKGNKLRNALLGALAGGAGGGALGYFGSSHIHPMSFSFRDADTAQSIVDSAPTNIEAMFGATPKTHIEYSEATRPLSVADMLGIFGNTEFIKRLNEGSGTNFPDHL